MSSPAPPTDNSDPRSLPGETDNPLLWTCTLCATSVNIFARSDHLLSRAHRVRLAAQTPKYEAVEVKWLCEICGFKVAEAEKEAHLNGWGHMVNVRLKEEEEEAVKETGYVGRGAKRMTFYCVTCRAEFPLGEQERHAAGLACRVPRVEVGGWTVKEEPDEQGEDVKVEEKGGELDEQGLVKEEEKEQKKDVDAPHPAAPEPTFTCPTCSNRSFPLSEQPLHNREWKCQSCNLTMHRSAKAAHKASVNHNWHCELCDKTVSLIGRVGHENGATHRSKMGVKVAPAGKEVKQETTGGTQELPQSMGTFLCLTCNRYVPLQEKAQHGSPTWCCEVCSTFTHRDWKDGHMLQHRVQSTASTQASTRSRLGTFAGVIVPVSTNPTQEVSAPVPATVNPPSESKTFFCEVCGKSKSVAGKAGHMKSKKHKKKVVEQAAKARVEAGGGGKVGGKGVEIGVSSVAAEEVRGHGDVYPVSAERDAVATTTESYQKTAAREEHPYVPSQELPIPAVSIPPSVPDATTPSSSSQTNGMNSNPTSAALTEEPPAAFYCDVCEKELMSSMQAWHGSKGWFCEVCKITTHEDWRETHIGGFEHMKLEPEEETRPYCIMCDKTANDMSKHVLTKGHRLKMPNYTPPEGRAFCEWCRTEFPAKSWYIHRTAPWECDDCGVKTHEQMKEGHLNGAKHAKRVAKKEEMKIDEGPAMDVGEHEEDSCDNGSGGGASLGSSSQTQRRQRKGKNKPVSTKVRTDDAMDQGTSSHPLNLPTAKETSTKSNFFCRPCRRVVHPSERGLHDSPIYHCSVCDFIAHEGSRGRHECSPPHTQAVEAATARVEKGTEMFSCPTCNRDLPVTVQPFHRSRAWACVLCETTTHMDWIGAHLMSDGHMERENDSEKQGTKRKSPYDVEVQGRVVKIERAGSR